MSSSSGPRRLVLVGGGHSHLEVLRRFGQSPLPDVDLLVVSAYPEHHYSGMVPGFLSGQYSEEAVRFLLEPMVSAVGGRFLQAKAVGLHTAEQEIALEDGTRIPYDLVSFGIGSSPAGGQSPEVATHAAVIKPMSRVVDLRHRLLAAAAGESAGNNGTFHAGVVGGGAAGVEVVLAIDSLLQQAGRRRDLFLVEAGETILGGYSHRFRRRCLRILADRSIKVITGTRVTAVNEKMLRFDSGQETDAGNRRLLHPAGRRLRRHTVSAG